MAVTGIGYGYQQTGNGYQQTRAKNTEVTGMPERPTVDDTTGEDYLTVLRRWRDAQFKSGNMAGYREAAEECNKIINEQLELDGTARSKEELTGTTKMTFIEGRLTSGIIGLSSFGADDNFRFISASYAADSTAENPIIEVRVNKENGVSDVYQIAINEIDPENATQLEMFALCTHADTQGISAADRSGVSYMTLMEYALYGGYGAENTADFTEKKLNWKQIVSEVGEKEPERTQNIAEHWTKLLLDLFQVYIEKLSEKAQEDTVPDLTEDEQEKTNPAEAGLFAYHKGVPAREQVLTDQKYTDEETGISWYVGEDNIPYMLGEDVIALKKRCEQTGEDWLGKAAQLIGLAAPETEVETVSVGKPDAEPAGATVGVLEAEAEPAGALEAAAERALETLAPDASDEIRSAWLEAAQETGVNGLGLTESGKLSHITQLSVQRAVRWYRGENTDVLGNSAESAEAAVEKALYDLMYPVEPYTNRSIEVQQCIEKEKEFYQTFLEKIADVIY